MRGVRRALLAVAAVGVVAGVIRLRGAPPPPPDDGGWRELSPNDFRP